MLFRQIQDLNRAALGYLIADNRSGLAIAIDLPPSQDLLTLALVQEQGLTLGYV